MYKNVQTDPEKLQTQHSCCSMLTLGFFLKAIRGNRYRFVPKGGTFSTKTIMLVVRSSGLWEAYTQTWPKWDKNFTMACWVPFHDSMPGFMNFRRVLDLLEFKNQVSQCLWPSDGGRVLGIHSHFFMRPKQARKDKIFDFSTNLYAREHVHVVQIWIVHTNALKTHLMHKNFQTNPENSQQITQHSCCSMLTRGKKLKAIRGNGYRFMPKGGTFPTETITLVVRSLYPNLR